MTKIDEIRREMDKILTILEESDNEMFRLIYNQEESFDPQFSKEIVISDIKQIRDSKTRERALFLSLSPSFLARQYLTLIPF